VEALRHQRGKSGDGGDKRPEHNAEATLQGVLESVAKGIDTLVGGVEVSIRRAA